MKRPLAKPEPAAVVIGDPGPVADVVLQPLDLPAGAEQQADGSVTLALRYPVTVRLGAAGERAIDQLLFQRLNGVQMRRVMTAKDPTNVTMAIATGLSPAHQHLLRAKMDASDVTAATSVIAALLDMGEGLPDRAETNADGSITLPLLFPGTVDALTLRRLTGADLDAIRRTEGADTLITLAARATGRTPKDMGEEFDAMDAADITALQRVASFLAGIGR